MPRHNVTLFNVLVHMLTENCRHAGHADILREQLDDSTGTTAEQANPHGDADVRNVRHAKIEQAAKAAAAKRDRDH